MAGGGLEFIEQLDKGPGSFGTKLSALECENVPDERFVSFAKEQGMVSDIETIASFDYNTINSYGIIQGKYKDKKALYQMVVSFQTAFDDEYSGHYRDSSAMEIIRDLAVVANRWFYVDRAGLVYMLPRENNRGTVALKESNTLEATKTVRKEQDIEIKLNRLQYNDDGKVTSYGLSLLPNEISSIKSAYRNLFSGPVTERFLLMYNLNNTNPGVDLLLREVSWDHIPSSPNIGTVVGLEHSFLEDLTRARIEDGV
jgi:hypothetical protein